MPFSLRTRRAILGSALALAVLILPLGVAVAADVMTFRTPEDGIQPQAAVDANGTVHLIYYKGDAGAGDIFYVRRTRNASEFSKPVQVNTQKGSAIAAGTIRGAQLAIGRNGRVHVVWDGMGKGARKVSVGGKDVAPLLYTRLNDAGTAFEPERNVITYAAGLDGGSSVAADASGNVYVVWHGSAPENTDKEAGRAVFVARSTDDGKSFAPEKPAVSSKTGACACCGMRAFADRQGAVYILFRAATGNTERGETLLVSRRPGDDFELAYTHPWKATQCPMSSATIAEAGRGVLAAWETGDNVYFTTIDPATMQVGLPVSPAPGAKRKHPVVIGNAAGETLLVWTEGTAWAKGGSVAWQRFDRSGSPVGPKGRALAMPAWSLPTAFVAPQGDFVVIY